jgi:6-phosphofructokinase 1
MNPPQEREELFISELRRPSVPPKLAIEGPICVGGDGTLNGLQPLAERLPTALAPKTIDNDLGLNYPSEPDELVRVYHESSVPICKS